MDIQWKWLVLIGVAAVALYYFHWLRNRKVVGLAIGVFDFCHEGHINLLRRAATQCDQLVVAVHTDEIVRQYKKIQPLNSERERAAMVEALGIAHRVVIDSDRRKLCLKNRIKKIFHGDDWSAEDYRRHWGEDLLSELGIEVCLLPHTPGINSTALRAEVPRIGWWLYSSVPSWSRSHIFSHLRGLYENLGGVWFLARTGREAVREVFTKAPCAYLESGQEASQATQSIQHYDLDVIITAHFDYESMADVMGELDRPISLVVLSHGRSGKKGTSADVARQRKSRSSRAVDTPIPGGRCETIGNLTIHDWSYAQDSYLHLDAFLARGGSLINPVPTGRPRILILPTWSVEVEKQGLILSSRWYAALRELSEDHDLVLSPHPLADSKTIHRFLKQTGATLLPASGHSHVHVPAAHCTISDLSGAFWEALLFDTPAVLAAAREPKTWADDLAPAKADLLETVPECTPENLAETVGKLVGQRSSQQNSLAEQRLGRIDGLATRRLQAGISQLLEKSQSQRKAV